MTLGATRISLRRRLRRYTVRHGADVFCLAAGPGIRVGYPSAAILRRLGRRARTRTAGRAVLALTANRRYALHGVRVGARLTPAVRRQLRLGRSVRSGRNTWYQASLRGGTAIVKVSRGRVGEIGIAASGLTRGRGALRRLLATLARG